MNFSCYTIPPRGRKVAKSVKARVKPKAPKVLTPISDEEDSVHYSRTSTPIPSDSEVEELPAFPIIPPSQDIAPSMSSSKETSQRSKKGEALFLTDALQEDVIDWMREQAIIYKSLRDYWNSDKKRKLWADKAKAMRVDDHKLQTRMDSLKSRYGRLTQTKSGQGVKEHTEREVWLLDKFSFLKSHIAHQTSRHGVSVST